LVTDDSSIFLRSREYSDHGHEYNPKFPRGEDTRATWGFNYKVTELHGAIGLAQLKKMDYVLQKQQENKKKIKDGLKDIKNIEFREIPDAEGDAGDTLIFFLETREKAKKFAELLSKKGIGTKNLPDAINWHFAGTWTHIFKDYPEYKGKNLEDVWKQSSGLLRRAIAIPILVKMTPEQISSITAEIRQTAEDIKKR
ncbi:MAG: DegT/DnrJ/EryC1/StrS family aminotransferase, partial [Candidatus Woesearchaeota archaeon]|nr:DegT/DnrJ/EryC1/StrS family aminotransferase [Candidatus Woesearchaeota archaeon]